MEPRSDVPEAVGWEVTRQCNLTCAHCYTAASRRPPDELTTEEALRLIDEIADLGGRVLGFTGGEPLLRRDLEALCAKAVARGMACGVTTNGLLLDPERARGLKEAGLSFVQISLDGATAERNARLRGASAAEFSAAMEAARCCGHLGLPLYLAMVLGRETLDDAPAMFDLAARLGARAVRFCGFVPAGRGRGGDVIERLSCRPEAERRLLRAFVKDALDRDLPAMFDPAFGPLPGDGDFHKCSAGIGTLYIGATGKVYPCTALIAPRFVVGNVRERPLAAIWADPRMTEIARFPHESITGPCRECASFDRCGGGCRGAVYAHTRDLASSFPLCLHT